MKRAKRRRMDWRRKGKPARSRVSLGTPLHRVKSKKSPKSKLSTSGSGKVYVVVGEWHGLVDKVEAFSRIKRAWDREEEIKKEYGKDEIKSGESTVQVFECPIVEG